MTDLRIMVENARRQVEAGNAHSAEVFYHRILEESSPPNSGIKRVARGEACIFFAQKALKKKRLGEAGDWYRQAIMSDPYAVDYRVDLCLKALLPMGFCEVAKREASRAVKIAPDAPHAWRALGAIEHELGNAEASVEAYDRQLELIPDEPNAILDRVTIAIDTGEYDLTKKLLEPVLKTDRAADAWHCLGMVAYRQGHHEDAIAAYDKAIELGCHDKALARWNKSLAMHSIGLYKEGWVEHEQRGYQKTNSSMAVTMRRFTLPQWKDQPAPASIHVHHEQGMGDSLCLARYLPMLVERGYDVRFEAPDQMVSLLQHSMPEVKIMPKAVDYPGAIGIPIFDYHIPTISLPYAFGTDIDTVPWNGPYLKPDPELVEQYKALLYLAQPTGAQRKIGLVWSSGIRVTGIWIKEYGRRKSMRFDTLLPIIEATNDLFVSLQVGEERLERRDPVIDLLPDKPTWMDTAALIANLDLVITVDTAVAHLAGAMGKPVWVMMHTEGSWHWMTKRTDSPWYPTAKLYRQDKAHDWDNVIARVAGDLTASVAWKAA
jgi:hypothetical protein